MPGSRCYFDSSGWVQFDPTPLGGGQGGQQGFVGDAGAATSAAPLPSDDVPTAGLGIDEPTARGGEPTALTSQALDGAGSNDDKPAIAPGWWVALAILALVAAAAAGPNVVRRRRRDRRLAEADAGGPGAAAAAWREVEDLAVDHGIGLNPAESARAHGKPAGQGDSLCPSGDASQLRELVTAVERGWYGTCSRAELDLDEPRRRRPASAGRGNRDRWCRPAAAASSLGRRPATIAVELQHHVPLSAVDRLVPRSVRPVVVAGLISGSLPELDRCRGHAVNRN